MLLAKLLLDLIVSVFMFKCGYQKLLYFIIRLLSGKTENMGLDKKNAIIDNRSKDKRNNSKYNLFLPLGGVVAVIALGFMSFCNISGNSMATSNFSEEKWETEEQPRAILASAETMIEEIDIVIVITPSKEQMERLRRERR